MKFTLNAPEASHGIRVIEAIPDEALCRIEGRNGIGKTLAIHLLELCTGQQPYTSRLDAWRTLCAHLGPVTVTIDGLRGPSGDEDRHQLRFAFDWRERTDEPFPLEIRRDLFNEITLDGDDVAGMDDVRRWLTVVRVAGDETLTETVAGLVAYDHELLRTAGRVAGERSRYLDTLFDKLLQPFPREPADDALAAAEELRGLSAERAELVVERVRQHDAVVRYEAAQGAYAAVAQVTADADTLDAEIISLGAQFKVAGDRRALAERELAVAQEQRRLSEETAKQLASAQRTFTRRLNALERADRAVAIAALGVAADPEAVAAELAALADERTRLARDRGDLSDLFALRDVLDGMVQALAPAAASGLRARTVAVIGGEAITAGELLDAVRARRERLTADAPAVEDLDRRLAELAVRERELDRLGDAIADRSDKRDRVAEAEEALQQIAGTDPASDHLITEKAAARAAAQRVEIEVGSALGAAQRQRAQLGGGLSLADLRADLERRLTEAGTMPDAIDEQLRKARGMLAALDDRLDVVDARRDALLAELTRVERALDEFTHRLHADAAHARLRAVLGDRAPRVGDAAEDQARLWVGVHAAQDRAVQCVQGVRGGLDATAANLQELVSVIRDKSEASPDLDPVRRLYQERLLERFRQQEIVDALFDGGSLTRVDLAARAIRWRTSENEPRVRPFEAFSSGERAFAYVQARLGGVAQVAARNRVVAVDEFGAFLSRDRLIRLQQVVQRQLDDGLIDQAIVILPLGAVSVTSTTDIIGNGPELLTGVFDVLAEA